ncbi:DAK2 domain-containing protein [Bulleidia sp. zg-1006]|uniref:DAK2 domain-containing protein n=1 Tax=Bulleidia sp. zg-1006 TaxID=2806552 RepID=UPI001939DD55|nr:DAK2 domain-containing protein [Bulleidia sp. zg-1006]QRG87402.1 DAK2 domain-containing protein [Bulleidia sp. zg-1006]
MKNLNGEQFRVLLESGANALYNRKAEVDAMNVFPVPDGDTGTNMSLTIQNGIEEVDKSGSTDLFTISKVFSRGLLMGARGNSGVILSQIFRGLSKYVKDNALTTLSANDFTEALMAGARLAYKAVMKPTEGTILTVLRESAEYGQIYMAEHPNASVEELIAYVDEEAQASLQRTPELLSVLKEAGCIDSGGFGYTIILDGFVAALKGEPVARQDKPSLTNQEEILSGYRVEVILPINEEGKAKYDEVRLRKQLSQFGSDIGVFDGGDEICVSLRTIAPGEVVSLIQRYGEFKKVQVEALKEGLKVSLVDEFNQGSQEEKEYGIISVAAGSGLVKLFKDYQVDYVISGGQTMNPATEDFIHAIKKVNAHKIFILPNNSNIILAAKQAADVIKDKKVVVLESKSILQGISACLIFNPNESLNENQKAMQEAIANVKSGSITYAVKDTSMDGKEIHAGDYMGIHDKEIVSISKNRLESALGLLKSLIDEKSEIVTIICGEDANEEETNQIKSFLDENYEVDVDIQQGNQPVYTYLIGIE